MLVGASNVFGPKNRPQTHLPFDPHFVWSQGKAGPQTPGAFRMPRRGYRKPEPDRRHRLVKSYFTADEHSALVARSEATGLTLAAYVRACCLGDQPKAKPTRMAAEAIRQLAAVGNNLNQLTRHANSGKEPDGQEVRRVLDQVVAAIIRLGGTDDEEVTS